MRIFLKQRNLPALFRGQVAKRRAGRAAANNQDIRFVDFHYRALRWARIDIFFQQIIMRHPLKQRPLQARKHHAAPV